MAISAKPVLLYRCRQCGRGLELGQVVAPGLGLAKVACPRCNHQHLFSALDLQMARTAQFQNEPVSPGVVGFLRRIVHLQL